MKSKRQLEGKYFLVEESWKKFASLIQKNPEIKKFVFERDRVCQACRKDIPLEGYNTLLIHHLDYDHVCSFSKTITLPDRPNRKIPDCGNCRLERPDLFSACTTRLAAVHKVCNHKIELMARRYYSQNDDRDITPDNIPAEPINDGLDWLRPGAIFTWVENVRSKNRISASGKRTKRVGLQEVRGRIDLIEGDYFVIKVLDAIAIDIFHDVEYSVFEVGEVVRKKRSTLLKRGAKEVDEY